MTVNFASRARWAEYSPANLGWSGKWDPMRHPDLLVPFSFTTQRGEVLHFGSMHRLVVPIYHEFYTRLDRKHPGVLHGDPDEGCYNPNSRTENGSRSFHTWAIATDTEWGNNPMGVGVHRHGNGALPDDTGAIGRPLMIQWGGEWTSFKDFMHNEFHGSPQDAIDLTRELTKLQGDDDMPLTDKDLDAIDARIRKAWRDYTRDDSDNPNKDAPGHQLRSVIQNEVKQQTDPIKTLLGKVATKVGVK